MTEKMRITTFILAWLCMLGTTWGATVRIGGQVTLGTDETGFSGHVVEVRVNYGDAVKEGTTTTDASGIYKIDFEVPSVTNSADSLMVRVRTFDFCSGTYQVRNAVLSRMDQDLVLRYNFQLCRDFIAPDNQIGCHALFFFDQLSEEAPYDVQFLDLSYSNDPVLSWAWDFGDGTTSEEPTPLHQYDDPGSYIVTLAIAADSCQSTFSTTVVIGADGRCDCPDVFEPVCINDPATGVTQTFINDCWAECAGISADSYVRCNDCNCPRILDPVCVRTTTGTETFENACVARCAGYLTEELFACQPDPDCFCGEIYDPVCVFLDTGEYREFPNACYAACEGYYTVFPCENIHPDSCQAAFFADYPDPVELLVIFNDISITAGEPVVEWAWDFGDGNSSNEPNPTHVYQAEGSYLVRLKIATADGCTAGTEQQIDIGLPPDCICPAIYDPVCVVLNSSGYTITFPNACQALCVGFEEQDLVACTATGDCADCPDVEEPVCAVTDNGDVVRFKNPCLARCAGYEELTVCEIDSCICPLIFDPVCVAVEQDTLTFDNECLALCEGFAPDQIFACAIDTSCVCPAVYDPVCIYTPGGSVITFENECRAICAGYRPEHLAPCPTECECSDEINVVCARQDNGELIRFKNECEAKCAGYDAEQLFNCEDEPCVCPEYYDPVCAIGPDGTTVTFSNKCFAACEGYFDADLFSCTDTCACPRIYDPVCIFLDDGQVFEFPNKCEAECAGFPESQFEQCRPDSTCICPEIFAPVCVIDANGQIRSFTNACYANCSGYSETDFVACDAGGCACPLIFEPVCVIDSGNVILTFPNRCFAECEGYADYIACEDRDLHCFANFDWEEAPTGAPTPVLQFTDRSFSQESEIIAWQWEFGDGTMSNESNPLHPYPIAGGYLVRLTITTADSCQATTERYLAIGNDTAVGGPQCQAMFFFTQDSTQSNLFHFTDLSIGAADTWHWDFGDGQTSNLPSPSHAYELAGSYLVTLTIRSGVCESTTEMLLVMDEDIWYNRECTALFLPLINADSLEVFFLNLSSEDATGYFWEFGDGATSNDFVTSHRYQNPGTYEIRLTITTESGCSNVFTVLLDFEQNDFRAAPQFLTTTDTEEAPPLVSDLSLFPNPASERATLRWEANEGAEIGIQLRSLDGRMLQQWSVASARGRQQQEIDTSGLPAGVYAVIIRTERNTRSLKLVVNR